MDIDVLVVGAGQAGLAVTRQLRRLGVAVLAVDASRVGDNWRRRYASLRLFTPRRSSGLPGLALSGDPDGYATATEFADYLEAFARKFELPVQLGDGVATLTRPDSSFFATLRSGRVLQARLVIIATGGFQSPRVPPVAAGLSHEVQQFTSSTYRWPADVRGTRVLVVGDGATGRDIAAELADGRHVTLATGRPRRMLPERVLAISTWRWLRWLGLLGAPANSPIGRLMQRADPFPDRQRSLDALRGLGVLVRPRVTSANCRNIGFADGSAHTAESVIWCVGYRDDSSWVQIAGAVAADSQFLHAGGRSPVDGLYFVGRPWQRNRASALVMGADADAAAIAPEVAARLGHDARPPLPKALGLR